MDAKRIKRILAERYQNGYNIFVDEFTFGDYRIDGACFDTKKRWIRGFEIKVSRSDFLSDSKYQMYSGFLSSLSVVCPSGLIKKDEVPSPFGLLWVSDREYPELKWVKRPKNFQKIDCLAWFHTYTKAIELEFNRLSHEHLTAKRELEWYRQKEK